MLGFPDLVCILDLPWRGIFSSEPILTSLFKYPWNAGIVETLYTFHWSLWNFRRKTEFYRLFEEEFLFGLSLFLHTLLIFGLKNLKISMKAHVCIVYFTIFWSCRGLHKGCWLLLFSQDAVSNLNYIQRAIFSLLVSLTLSHFSQMNLTLFFLRIGKFMTCLQLYNLTFCQFVFLTSLMPTVLGCNTFATGSAVI